MKMALFLLTALSLGSAANADICGIVTQAQGRTAANIIDAKIAQNGGATTLIDDLSGDILLVNDALVSNKNGSELDGSKYFDFVVNRIADRKDTKGRGQAIDIGHTYLLLNDGVTAISLESLTGCANFGSKEILQLRNGVLTER